jgi:hypothetical protein
MLALFVDVGIGYSQRRVAQNAADAASSAAARLIALDDHGLDGAVLSEIELYTQLNHAQIDWAADPPYYVNAPGDKIAPVGTGGPIPSGARGVFVRTHITISTTFAAAPIVSDPDMEVAANAFAVAYQAKMPTKMGGMIPLSIPKKALDEWNQVICWGSQYGQTYDVPSYFKGILDLNDGSGPGYSEGDACGNKKDCVVKWISYGFDGTIGPSDWIQSFEGELGNNVKSPLQKRIYDQGLSDAKGSYGYLILPVWDQEINGSVHIWGFAQVKAYAADVGPNSAPVKFVSFVTPNAEIDTGGWQSIGPKVIKLFSPSN